jgi:hypothetical protein
LLSVQLSLLLCLIGTAWTVRSPSSSCPGRGGAWNRGDGIGGFDFDGEVTVNDCNRSQLDVAAEDDGAGAFVNDDARGRVDGEGEVLDFRDEGGDGCSARLRDIDVDACIVESRGKGLMEIWF